MTTKETIKLILSSPEITNVVIMDHDDRTPSEACLYLLDMIDRPKCWRMDKEGKHVLLIY